MSKYVVLMYHRVVSQECPVPDEDHEERRYAVGLGAFEWQMDHLVEVGRRGVSMKRIHDTLAAGEPVPESWVGITFDDGNASDHTHALPLLRERGFDATFYICGSRVEAPGGLTKSMIRQMGEEGMHIAAHGMTHRFLTTLTPKEEVDELDESKRLLEDITGATVDHFAPPGGRIARRTTAALARLGYVAVGTSQFGYNGSRISRFCYRRIPVVEGTGRDAFYDIVSARVIKLLPAFARAASLRALRMLLGEGGYRRLRGASLGK